MAVKRITVPFANTGEKTEIPLDAQANGSVSREKGFGEHYELPYDNPNAKDIERTIFNQIEFEQDSAIAEIQKHGVSVFSNENGYSYPKGALVFFDGAVYQSLKDDNSDEPSTANWAKVLAGEINNASLAQKGIVKLNNSVTSTSTTEAATPSAVKQAYDKAVDAQESANRANTAVIDVDNKVSTAQESADRALQGLVEKRDISNISFSSIDLQNPDVKVSLIPFQNRLIVRTPIGDTYIGHGIGYVAYEENTFSVSEEQSVTATDSGFANAGIRVLQAVPVGSIVCRLVSSSSNSEATAVYRKILRKGN